MNLNIDVTHIFENAFSGTCSQQHNKEFSWTSDLLNKQKETQNINQFQFWKEKKNQQELASFSILLAYIGPFLSSEGPDKLYWKCYKYLISCWKVCGFFLKMSVRANWKKMYLEWKTVKREGGYHTPSDNFWLRSVLTNCIEMNGSNYKRKLLTFLKSLPIHSASCNAHPLYSCLTNLVTLFTEPQNPLLTFPLLLSLGCPQLACLLNCLSIAN